MEILRIGSTGQSVKELQNLLFLVEDGRFGNLTDEAVKKFQADNNLKVDGIVGEKTWTKLKSQIKKTSRKIDNIILHCSATPEGKDFTVEQIRQWHKNNGWSDIGYHYVIYRDGTVHNGRDINKIGAHTSGHNTGSIGICYIGGTDANSTKIPKDTRTPEQKQSLVKLVNKLLELYLLKKSQVHGHYQYANKACPAFKIEPFIQEL